MNTQRLRQLGLTVREGPEVQVDQSLADAPLVNPVTREPIGQVTWAVRSGWMVSVAPPALQQVASVPVAAVESAEGLMSRLHTGFRRLETELQRRSTQLQALGLSPHVDPSSLELRTELVAGAERYLLLADRLGNFRLAAAYRGEQRLVLPTEVAFELSEFRDSTSLASFLADLVGAATRASPAPAPEKEAVHYGELARAFGEWARVPPSSTLELLVELNVGGRPYRFAAARVVGRTFRGLLASSRGKVWAERFDLDGFAGVVPLVAQVLGVPHDAVKVLRSQQE